MSSPPIRVAQNAVYINDGTGNFPAVRDFITGWSGAAAVAVGDMDGDGLPDIVSGKQQPEATWSRSTAAGALRGSQAASSWRT